MMLAEEIILRQTVLYAGVGTALGVGFVYGVLLCYRPQNWLRTFLKAIPLAALCIAAAANSAPWLVLVALAASLLGDIFLSREGDRAFLAGLIGFAVAHVAYAIHFFGLSLSGIAWGPTLGVLALALSTEIWLIPHVGALKVAVRIYVLLIFSMAATALMLEARTIATLGALLFVASDFILALQTFRLSPLSKWQIPTQISLWFLYILAQVAIVLGAGFPQPLFSI